MRSIQSFLTVLVLLLLRSCCAIPVEASDLAAPLPADILFNVTYLFTAKLVLGQPPAGTSEHPITIPGGVIVAEPIYNGTASGPYLNATISTGIATPNVFNNGTLQEPVIDLYGITEDGFPFHIHETGVGTPSAQITRIKISVGGGAKYQLIRDGYILATVNPNSDRSGVSVQGYLIQNTAGA